LRPTGSSGGNFKTQDLGPGENVLRDQIRSPEVPTTADVTDTGVRRSVMDLTTIAQPIRVADSVRETINQDGAVLLDIKQVFCFSMNPVGEVVGNRFTKERLDFVYHFAFPPSHAELLSVPESKKERSAYEEQSSQEVEAPRLDPKSTGERTDAFERSSAEWAIKFVKRGRWNFRGTVHCTAGLSNIS
jgi:hypothetical protein